MLRADEILAFAPPSLALAPPRFRSGAPRLPHTAPRRSGPLPTTPRLPSFLSRPPPPVYRTNVRALISYAEARRAFWTRPAMRDEMHDVGVSERLHEVFNGAHGSSPETNRSFRCSRSHEPRHSFLPGDTYTLPHPTVGSRREGSVTIPYALREAIMSFFSLQLLLNLVEHP